MNRQKLSKVSELSSIADNRSFLTANHTLIVEKSMSNTNQKRIFGLLDDLRYARIASARISADGLRVVYEMSE